MGTPGACSQLDKSQKERQAVEGGLDNISPQRCGRVSVKLVVNLTVHLPANTGVCWL